MEVNYVPEQPETVSVQVVSSPLWEVILGIAGYTYRELRHTFDQDAEWRKDSGSMPVQLKEIITSIQETNLWHALIMLQNEVEAKTSVQFIENVSLIPKRRFYDILLPYKNRSSEKDRIDLLGNMDNQAAIDAYCGLFEGHPYLSGYIREIAAKPYNELLSLLAAAVSEYEQWVSNKVGWNEIVGMLDFEQKLYNRTEFRHPIEDIERITGGVRYFPEPSIWNIKLIPHIAYRPWVLEKRTADTKLFFYPLKDDYFLKPGDPPKELVRGFKSLGDELRLKLVYELQKGPISLQDLSAAMQMSKTTLHHQLSLLKAAKFVKAEKGIYQLRMDSIIHLQGKLLHFLGID
ncbi:ArsR/SmtB family transcription factor [Bacillus sp. 1P06AnD]|uniref:ArsR/SmtB family transcription factor n=1 Tax=Bacillus sp. 1P06AnD TaxID=3132208 RepID=UPI0039A39354